MGDEVRNGGRHGIDDGPEAEPRDGGVTPELDCHPPELAGLGQEAAGQEGAAEPHAPIPLNLKIEEEIQEKNWIRCLVQSNSVKFY